MIYIFRKEMKKWHTVLWVVFAALGLSGVSFFIFRQKHVSEISVATVNSEPVYFDQYRRALTDIQERINSLRPMARLYGMSEELFLSTFLGVTKPEEFAIDTCVKDTLIDQVKDRFSILLDENWFKQEFIKLFPQLTDESGSVNMDMYQHYLERLSTTPAEYEKRKREDFKRDLVQRFVQGAAYVPGFVAKDTYEATLIEKSFSVIKVPLEYFVARAHKEQADDKTLETFYLTNKEDYKVSEKRKARYWELSADDYAKKIQIDEPTIKHFYDKHKSTLYRIPPKVKVRTIVIKTSTKDAQALAKEIHKQVTEHQDRFAEIAKQKSQDEKTAKAGGLIDFFGKGTYDQEFERAAFRLKTEREISPVIKTKDGYQIIQLVGRINASEKSFESVKGEIEKSLRAKRSAGAVRADLEMVMRSMREDAKALDAFVEQNKLEAKETGWLSDATTKQSNLEGLLAKRLFSTHKRNAASGYFAHENIYIIYQCADVVKGHIPSFKDVKDKVSEDYYQEKAESGAKNALKDARIALLTKKTTLDQIAKTFQTSVIITEKIKKGDNLKELNDGGSALRDRLLQLTSKVQVLEQRNKDIFFLAQIKELTPIVAEEFEKACPKIIKQEKYKTNTMSVSAFIASLYRNAKIEIDHKILQTQHVDWKE